MFPTLQRCIVVHGTSNMTIDSNVAFQTAGHCFIVEEGSEVGNTFVRNLGIAQRPVTTVIPPSVPGKFDLHTDNQPSTFWLSNPFNNLIGNVAAGSLDSG